MAAKFPPTKIAARYELPNLLNKRSVTMVALRPIYQYSPKLLPAVILSKHCVHLPASRLPLIFYFQEVQDSPSFTDEEQTAAVALAELVSCAHAKKRTRLFK